MQEEPSHGAIRSPSKSYALVSEGANSGASDNGWRPGFVCMWNVAAPAVILVNL